MKLTLNISEKSKSKALPLIEYLKTLDFLTVEQEEKISVPDWHKKVVRERILTSSPKDFIPWKEAKKQLKFK